MRVDVIMPQMGESIQEGTIVRWLKKVGDSVGRDEPLFEISTDKVDAEIPSPSAGTLAEVKVKEGETVAIKTVVAVIETEAGKAASAPAQEAAQRPASPPAGAPRPAPSAPAPAPPAPTATTPAPAAAAAASAARSAGAPSPSPAPSPSGPSYGGGPAGAGGGRAAYEGAGASGPGRGGGGGTAVLEERIRTKSSPVVRKIAAEHGVDITALQGSGIMGRVTKNDILGYLEGRGAASEGESAAEARPSPAAAAAGAMPSEALKSYPAFLPGERYERVPMTPMRKKIAEHMVVSKRTSAHVSTWFEIDMTRVAKIRAAKKEAFQQRHGVNLSFMPFIMKATVDALLAFPALNASIEGNDILYKKDVNLGIAVALDWGLIVPVVKNAQDLSLSGLAKAMNDLADRARKKQLKPEEVQGGTFTITNPGIYGSLMGTPIINQPQVAILGVGTIEKRPAVIDDAIAIRTMAYFSISFDHRLIDGAVADQFMARIKQTLQEFDESAV
jgi:2-oxoglutarate dehydrogenase E2 component (dihydrolipoamide succinyltransferase)